MNQLLTQPAQAVELLKGRLPLPPSAGLRQMLADVFAIGLPVQVRRWDGSPVGKATVTREGIDIALADVPLNEGVIAHELAHALLETRGWPRLIKGADDHWITRSLATLVHLLDHLTGLAMQKAYSINARTYEDHLLEAPAKKAQALLQQAEALAKLQLSDEQQVEFAIGVALAAVEQLGRLNRLPDEFARGLQLLPGAKALYTALADVLPNTLPMSGWEARRLYRMLIDTVDTFVAGRLGELKVLDRADIVPGIHPDESTKPVSQVADLVMVSPPGGNFGDYSLRVTNRRDGLPFGFKESFPNAAIAGVQVGKMQAEPFAQFCRAHIDRAILIWQPT